MSDYVKLTTTGLHNKKALLEVRKLRVRLYKAQDYLRKMIEKKYDPASPNYSDMPKGGVFEDASFIERKEAKEKEIEILERKLEIANLNINQKISDLPLSDDNKRLLRRYFIESAIVEDAFNDCNMSKSEGYRTLNAILNEITF